MQIGTKPVADKWDAIIDNLHESIIVTDAEGLITTWNKGAEHLFGYEARRP